MPQIQRIINAFDKEQIDLMLEWIYKKGQQKIIRDWRRDYIFLKLCAETGLRIGEACKIKLSDIDHKRRVIRVLAENNKNKREEFVYLHKNLYWAINFYIKFHDHKFKENYIFYSRKYKSKHLTPSGVYYFFRPMLEDLGLRDVKFIDKKGNKRREFVFHSLRKYFSTEIFINNPQLRLNEAGMITRHKDLRVLSDIYLNINAYNIQKETLENTFKIKE